MTGRAKRIYFLLKNKSKENETERAMILKTAEEILTLKQWLVFRMKINGFSQYKIAEVLNEQGILSPMEYKRSIGVRFKYMLPVLRFSAEKSEGGRFLCEEWNAL